MRSSPGKKALFLDNDGVLVDTEHLYYRATCDILHTVGIGMPEDLYRQLFLVEARGAWHLAREKGYTEEEIETLRRKRKERYREYLMQSDVAIPGVGEVLERLHRSVKIGIVTSSLREHFNVIHERTGFHRYFDFVIAEGDYTRSKPDPEPYLLALKKSGADPADCLVIEDSLRGLQSAKGAGLECWVIPRGLTKGSDFSRADRILTDFSEVLPLLELEKDGAE